MVKKSEFIMGSICLTDLKYGINPHFNNDYFTEGIQLQPQLETEIMRRPNENKALVSLSLKIFEKDSEKYPMWVEAKNQVVFEWPDDYDGDLDRFLSATGAFHLLSFLRPLVTQLTTMSLFPPLVLPLMDVSNIEVTEVTESEKKPRKTTKGKTKKD